MLKPGQPVGVLQLEKPLATKGQDHVIKMCKDALANCLWQLHVSWVWYQWGGPSQCASPSLQSPD